MSFSNKIFTGFMLVYIIFNFINIIVSQECANEGEDCNVLPCCDPGNLACNGETGTCSATLQAQIECSGPGEPCGINPCCDGLGCGDTGACP